MPRRRRREVLFAATNENPDHTELGAPKDLLDEEVLGEGLDLLLSNRKPSDLCGFGEQAMKGHERETRDDDNRGADRVG